MKKINRYIFVGLVMAALVGCMELLNVVHPDTAQINSTVEASFEVKVHIDPELGANRSDVLVGILAPQSWNLAESAVLTYSSADMPDGPADKLKMRLATDQDLNVQGVKWVDDFKAKLGTKGNYEPVEWVVFISEKKDHLWKPDDQFTATLNVSFKTGDENIKTKLVYFIGNTADGVHSEPKYYLMHEQLFTTTGGTNELIDYTIPKMCFMTPANFTYEDILAYTFDPNVEVGGETPLKGAEEVHFMSVATYGEGQTVAIEEVSEKTKMVKSDIYWVKYMYPHEYFNIPASEKITKIEFYMVNADKSVVVKLPSGENLVIPEKNK